MPTMAKVAVVARKVANTVISCDEPWTRDARGPCQRDEKKEKKICSFLDLEQCLEHDPDAGERFGGREDVEDAQQAEGDDGDGAETEGGGHVLERRQHEDEQVEPVVLCAE
eukprot:2901596-Rhodomonas_salina.1